MYYLYLFFLKSCISAEREREERGGDKLTHYKALVSFFCRKHRAGPFDETRGPSLHIHTYLTASTKAGHSEAARLCQKTHSGQRRGLQHGNSWPTCIIMLLYIQQSISYQKLNRGT